MRGGPISPRKWRTVATFRRRWKRPGVLTCFTADLAVEGSVTNKAYDVCGAHKSEVLLIATKGGFGHVCWHWATNKTVGSHGEARSWAPFAASLLPASQSREEGPRCEAMSPDSIPLVRTASPHFPATFSYSGHKTYKFRTPKPTKCPSACGRPRQCTRKVTEEMYAGTPFTLDRKLKKAHRVERLTRAESEK